MSTTLLTTILSGVTLEILARYSGVFQDDPEQPTAIVNFYIFLATAFLTASIVFHHRIDATHALSNRENDRLGEFLLQRYLEADRRLHGELFGTEATDNLGEEIPMPGFDDETIYTVCRFLESLPADTDFSQIDNYVESFYTQFRGGALNRKRCS